MQKRKGFTLVELVIVIAVIAILAGVLIGTFASVINRANDSARLQELKAQEIEQKADDILKKIEDSGWYGWEDFETSIVEKMTRVYKENQDPTLTQAKIKAAVTSAIEDYAKANANSKTNLTEDQVRAIVENAMGEINYSGVTEAQVKTIIETASDVKGAEVAQSTVREIVEAANANNLTAPEVAKIITINIGGATASDFDTKLAAAVAEIKASQRTDEDLTSLIASIVPVTKHVATAAEFETAVQTLQSGSTIYVDTEDLVLNFVLTGEDQVKTFTLRGKRIEKLTVNAPKATLFVTNNEIGTLDVIAVANNSLHTYGTVNNATIKAGRYVVEQGSVTGTLTAAPGADGETVAIEVGAGTSVNELVAQYQTWLPQGATKVDVNNYIQIVNAGRVVSAQLTGSSDWEASKNTTNVRIVNKAGATGTDVAKAGDTATTTTGSVTSTVEGLPFTVVDEATSTSTDLATTGTSTTYDVKGTVEGFWGAMYATSFAGGDGSAENPYQISNAEELVRLSWLMINEPLKYQGEHYILTNDISLSENTWMPISAYSRNLANTNWFTGTFDGQGYSITGLNDSNLDKIYHTGIVGSNSSTVAVAEGEYTFGLFGSVKGATIKNVTVGINLVNASFTRENKIYVADSVGGLVGFVEGNATISNIVVNGTVKGTDGVGGIVGRWYKKTTTAAGATIKDCVNNASVIAYNPAETGKGLYTHVAGILGFGSDYVISLSGNTNNGNVTGYAGAVYVACIANGSKITGDGDTNNATVTFSTISGTSGTQTVLYTNAVNAGK